LQTINLESLTTETTKEAFAVLKEQSEDIGIILLDWNMPGINGLEALKLIKAKEEWKHIPVIMLTSELGQERMLEAMQHGAINYITKPFTQEDLIVTVMRTVFLNQT